MNTFDWHVVSASRKNKIGFSIGIGFGLVFHKNKSLSPISIENIIDDDLEKWDEWN